MDFGRSSSEKQFGFSLLPRLTQLSDVQGNAETSCTLDGWMLPKDPSSRSTGGLCYRSSSPLGGGTSLLVTGDPLFAGSARAGAPLGTAMSPLTWLCCSDCCLEGQSFKPEPCDLNRRDFSWIPGWLEQGGWEQVNILPLSGPGAPSRWTTRWLAVHSTNTCYCEMICRL